MDQINVFRKPLLGRIAVVAAEIFWYGYLAFICVGIYMIAKAGADQLSWMMLSVMPAAVVMLGVAFMLRGIVHSTLAGSPFTIANVKRVRWMGLFLMLYGPLDWVGSNIWFATAYKSHLHSVLNFPFMIVFLGAMLLVLAQVFDFGVRLQTDNDLTV